MSSSRYGQVVIVISAPLLAQQLWLFGEPSAADRVITLSPPELAKVCFRAGQLAMTGEGDRLWPGGPNGHMKALILAVTESLEGKARPAHRTRRQQRKRLPAHLIFTEADERKAARQVADEVDRWRYSR